MMDIALHQPGQAGPLREHYQRAIQKSQELYIVSAYLTEWDVDVELNPDCAHFRLIVGKDFGITRKVACRRVLKWLPPNRMADFLVADRITGFHPKAMFWRSAQGRHFMVLGSSNLSRAAFDGNVEANVFTAITKKKFAAARQWIEWISDRCVPVSHDWLDQYVEANRHPAASSSKVQASLAESPVVKFKLPRPRDMERRLRTRRDQLRAYERVRPRLIMLFRDCADGLIGNGPFYDELGALWNGDVGNRLQGLGWERQGKSANFRELARSFVEILGARKQERDDVVRSQLDRLHDSSNSARKAFLSEMLCLRFPKEYPLLNNPVKTFLAENRFKAPRGASEGARYIDLARKLRVALKANPDYPALNLAELDALIWASAEQRKTN